MVVVVAVLMTFTSLFQVAPDDVVVAVVEELRRNEARKPLSSRQILVLNEFSESVRFKNQMIFPLSPLPADLSRRLSMEFEYSDLTNAKDRIREKIGMLGLFLPNGDGRTKGFAAELARRWAFLNDFDRAVESEVRFRRGMGASPEQCLRLMTPFFVRRQMELRRKLALNGFGSGSICVLPPTVYFLLTPKRLVEYVYYKLDHGVPRIDSQVPIFDVAISPTVAANLQYSREVHGRLMLWNRFCVETERLFLADIYGLNDVRRRSAIVKRGELAFQRAFRERRELSLIVGDEIAAKIESIRLQIQGPRSLIGLNGLLIGLSAAEVASLKPDLGDLKNLNNRTFPRLTDDQMDSTVISRLAGRRKNWEDAVLRFKLAESQKQSIRHEVESSFWSKR
ncbi:MAG: hypothetical protein ACRC1K_05175 [Planctomycetia bacterium]